MLTLETKLLHYIQRHSKCSLEDILKAFSKSSRFEILALLASLEEQREISCHEDDNITSFTAAKTTMYSLVESSYKALGAVAKQGVSVFNLVSGRSHKERQKNKARIDELEYLLDYEFDAYKCSHYQVELMLLRGSTLEHIALETGYSEVWLKQLAKQFRIGFKHASTEVQVLPAQVQLREQLDAVLPVTSVV